MHDDSQNYTSKPTNMVFETIDIRGFRAFAASPYILMFLIHSK